MGISQPVGVNDQIPLSEFVMRPCFFEVRPGESHAVVDLAQRARLTQNVIREANALDDLLVQFHDSRASAQLAQGEKSRIHEIEERRDWHADSLYAEGRLTRSA